MAFMQQSLPPSALIKTKGDVGEGPKRQSKEEWRRAKELEEARKAGTAPAAVDDEGRDINPHIPHFVATAPWYALEDLKTRQTLKHQRQHSEKIRVYSSIAEVDSVKAQKGVVDTSGEQTRRKFVKGACENCGSTSHKRKDCMERPRQVGARFTKQGIAPSEHKALENDLSLSFDAKRDRWAGYDPSQHAQVIEEFEKLDEARKMVRTEQLEETEDGVEVGEGGEVVAAEEEKRDEDKYAEESDMPGVKVDTDSRTRITVRNLRIREDTAKYLYNLDPESAYYDPKSRSMRDNPFGIQGKAAADVPFGGENFVRYSGEVVDVAKAQLFAWEAQARGGADVHALAEPTKLETLQRETQKKVESTSSTVQKSILNKYGGEEYFKPKEQLPAQTEAYVEYNRKGKVIKGEERMLVKSRYPEDVLEGNHKRIFGSWYSKKLQKWGFACCHQILRNSFCTGEAGVMAEEEAPAQDQPATTSALPVPQTRRSRSSSSSSSSASSSSESEDAEKSPSPGAAARREQFERDEQKRATRRAKRHRAKERRRDRKADKRDRHSSEDDDSDDEGKSKKTKLDDVDVDVNEVIKKQLEEERKVRRLLAEGKDERHLPYNAMEDITREPTRAEMEAYQMRRVDPNDPMAKYFEKKNE